MLNIFLSRGGGRGEGEGVGREKDVPRPPYTKAAMQPLCIQVIGHHLTCTYKHAVVGNLDASFSENGSLISFLAILHFLV